MAASERCVCPCHTHSGTYPPPCNFCGHDTRDGRWVGGYRGWWEPNNDPRDEQIGRLTALLAERDAEIAAWVDAADDLLSHPTPADDHAGCWFCGGGLGNGPNGHKDACAWSRLLAALAARGGEVGE